MWKMLLHLHVNQNPNRCNSLNEVVLLSTQNMLKLMDKKISSFLCSYLFCANSAMSLRTGVVTEGW